MLKVIVGELAYEVSEGLENGFEDFRRSCEFSFQNSLGRFTGGDQNLNQMFMGMFGNTFISLIQGCYEFYSSRREQMEEEGTQARRDEINRVMQELQQFQVPPVTTQASRLSDAYKKGSIDN